jgi:heat shock protein HtpX
MGAGQPVGVERERSTVHGTHNGLKTAMLLGLLSAIIVVAGGAFAGQGGLVIAVLIAFGVNGYTYFNSDTMALKSMRAYPVSQVSTRSSTPPSPSSRRPCASRCRGCTSARPRRRTPSPPGRNPQNAAVCCTEGILELLDERELRGVLGHELAHVGNRDILISSVAAALATVITFLASMAQFAMIFGGRDRDSGNMLSACCSSCSGPIAAGVIQMAISRNREYAADATGAQVTGDPLALASALRKLEHGTAARPLVEDPQLAPTSSMMIANPFRGGGPGQAVQHPPADGRAHRAPGGAGRLPTLLTPAPRCGVGSPVARPRGPLTGPRSRPISDGAATGSGALWRQRSSRWRPTSLRPGRSLTASGPPPAGGTVRDRRAAGPRRCVPVDL